MAKEDSKTGSQENLETLRRRVGELERWFKRQDSQIRLLERERQKLSALVNHTKTAYLVVDSSCRVVWVNRAFVNHHKASALDASPVGRLCREVLCRTPEGCPDCPCARSIETNQVVGREAILEQDGEPHFYYISAMPIASPEGAADESIIMMQDITDLEILRRSQDQHRTAAEAAEAASLAKSQFLANVSHEIRTPLNGIIGMTDVLLTSEVSEEQRKGLDIVRNSSVALLELINDLLDFSKIEAGKMVLEDTSFDLRLLLDEIMALLAHKAREKGLVFECIVDPKIPREIVGDVGRLRQVLINLMGNALKFTSHGSVRTSATLEEDDGQQMLVHFVVHDSGIGIPAHARDRLFRSFSQVDPSTTRKYGGTGLGLAISAQLVQLMGGTIDVQSQLGRGSTFTFTVRVRHRDVSAA